MKPFSAKVSQIFRTSTFVSKYILRSFVAAVIAMILIQSDDINSQLMFFNTQLQTGESIKQIETGYQHTCALFANGRVKCWGDSDNGKTGYGNGTDLGDNESPISVGYVNVGGFVKQISLGNEHTCALLANGAVRCWGTNSDWGSGGPGRLGYGNTTEFSASQAPAVAGDVPVGGAVKQISAGHFHTCALLVEGNVRCWGEGSLGRLGYGNTNDIGDNETPAQAGDVSVGGIVKQVSAGFEHTCVLLVDGNVRCWGNPSRGELGYGNVNMIGDNESPSSAGNVSVGGLVKQISANRAGTTCALLVDGNVKCWGYNQFGEAGQGHTNTLGDTETPSSYGNINLGGQAEKVFFGGSSGCALLTNGNVRCWGKNDYGQLGYGNTTFVGTSSAPTSPNAAGDVGIAGLDGRVIYMSVSDRHTCALYSNGKARCWGWNAYGQLGYADTTDRGHTAGTIPSALGYVGTGGEVAVKQVTTGTSHTCALLSNGDVRCWGGNSVGQLGYGHTTGVGGAGQKLPSQMGKVYIGGKVKQLASGNNHNCALLENGKVRCWGQNDVGQLGYSNATAIGDDDVPAKAGDVSLGQDAVQLGCGSSHCCTLLKDGTVRCWGLGTLGRLGYGNTDTIGDNELPSTVGPVSLGENAVQITVGREHNCALLESGNIRCWGEGNFGRLGGGNMTDIGDNETPSSVSVVSVGAPATQVSAGEAFTCALLQTGDVKCWGDGVFGELGYASTDDLGDDELPSSYGNVSIGGKATKVVAGNNITCAIINGRARCWGRGGRTGLGNATNIGDDEIPSTAAYVETGGNMLDLATSLEGSHTCAVLERGSVLCWGTNSSGQLGLGNNSDIGDDEVPTAGGQVKLLPNSDEAAPPNPTNLVATPISGPAMTLTWQSGGGSTCDYKISYALTAAPANCNTGTQIASSSIYGNSHTITGLTGATLYGFRVCAVNCDVPTPEMSSGVATTATTLAAPPPNPTGETANPVNPNRIDLSWTSGGGTTTDYRISYLVGLVAPATCSTGNTIGEGSITGTSHQVTGLAQGTTYTFRICAINGNTTPDESSGVTLVSATPNPVPIYRSIGFNSTSPLASGGSNSLDIVGSTATFGSALPLNVGVGDAIQYDSDNNGSIDAIAFIHGRTSATVYTIKTATGGIPTATTAADQDWGVYRAYTNCAAALGTQTENIGIDNTQENFDNFTNGKDAAAAGQQWNFALYGDATDTTACTASSGWVTDATYYIRLYSPYLATEVGVSQRHQGVWTPGAGTLMRTAGDNLTISTNGFYVEGIQFTSSSVSPNGIVRWTVNNSTTRGRVFNNIFRTNPSSGTIIMLTCQVGGSTTAAHYIYNNIFYVSGGAATTRALDWNCAGATTYVYNNTIYGTTTGIRVQNGSMLPKNNIVQGTSGNSYELLSGGSWVAGADYNLGDDATTPGGANHKANASVMFTNPPTGDLRLGATDAVARNAGTDLSADPNLPINLDITLTARPIEGVWDMGAHESAAVPGGFQVFRSVGTSTAALGTGSGANLLTITVASNLATFQNAQPDNFGVGDAIQYDCNTSGAMNAGDCIVFVSGRINSTNYTVQRNNGSSLLAGNAYTNGGVWASYRAYNSLFNAERGGSSTNGNASIDANVRNFDTWTNGINLTGTLQTWNFAYYADGEDNTFVAFNNWTTSAAYGIRIFVPNLTSEVGISQRHSGVWSFSSAWRSQRIDLRDDHMTLDGFQIWLTDPGGFHGAAYVNDQGATGIVTVKNNILVLSGTMTGSNQGIGVSNGLDPAAKVRLINNITYSLGNQANAGIDLESGSVFAYNNTIYNFDSGFDILGASTTVTLKNNIVQNTTDDAYLQSASQIQATSDYNISSDGTSSGGANDKINQTVRFLNTGSDFRLHMQDTVAKDAATDLSADSEIAFATDIVQTPRTDWDIGAHEASSKIIYRSVAAGVTSALATTSSPLAGNTLTIAGTTATFSKPLPDNVGVGDVIQYDCDNSGGAIAAGDCVAFISGRTSAKVFSVLSADGNVPTADSADTSWDIYRAYISLANWDAGTENTGIDSDVRAFDSGNRNLVLNNEIWNVAVYGNAAGTGDTTTATIDGWTTSAGNYIEVYSPILSSEVGISQRHNGVFNTQAYYLSGAGSISVRDNHVRVTGVQVRLIDPVANYNAIHIDTLTADADVRISQNIITATGTVGNASNGIAMWNSNNTAGTVKAYNNIVYGFNGTNSRCFYISTGSGVYYSNTAYNCSAGFNVSGATTAVAKNNIVQSTSGSSYVGTFSAASGYNISDDATTPGGTGDRTNSTVTFVDTASGNFRPAGTDTEARNNGISLAGDSTISFTTDARAVARPATWDIGALNADPFMMYRSLGAAATGVLASGGGTNQITISGTTATFATAPGNSIGVGDVIQYDSSGGGIGAGDSLAFITRRMNANQYTVYTAANGTPTAYTGSTWDICRAYDRLARVATVAENTCVNVNLRNFDSGATDLTSKKAVLNIAVYGSASADLFTVAWTPTTGSGWTVSPDYYLRIFSPYQSSEVGTSQRHSGVWDTAKYYMNVGGNGIAFNNLDYVKVDGLQILLTSPSSGAAGLKCELCSDVEFSNNIVRRSGGTNDAQMIWVLNGSAVAKIWNNIVYDFTVSGSTGITANYVTAYIYNNTLYTGVTGIYNWGAVVTAKNNVVQGTTSDSYVEYDGAYFTTSSGYNVSDDATSPGGTSETTSGTVSFSNAGSRDLRLANADTVAKGTGTNLGSDLALPFSTDATGTSRYATWDRGALLPAIVKIYRSVGPGNTAPLAASDGTTTLTIAGTTATFSTTLPDNVGVGDVIKWGANFVFISGRTSSTVYTVQNTTGGAPTTVAGNTAWSIYRAYTSLTNWESGTENTGHGLTFDAGNRDIATNGEQWNVACYGDGIDTTATDVSGWTTSASAYIRIYTPHLASEVGTRQRHIGRWDPKYYTLSVSGSGALGVLSVNYVRIEGLQVSASDAVAFNYTLSAHSLGANAEFFAISNLIRASGTWAGSTAVAAAMSINTSAKTFWINNISFGDASFGGASWGCFAIEDGTTYVYNNTGYNCGGYGMYSLGAATYIAKNNIIANNPQNFGGSFSSLSKNNVSTDGSSASATDKVSATVTFVDAGTYDFRLSPADAGAKNYGANLSSDFVYPFSVDIAENSRPVGTGWDAGASETNVNLFTDDGNGAGEFGGGTHSNTEWNASDSVTVRTWTVNERELANGDATFSTTNLESIWHLNGATINETSNATITDSGPGGNNCTFASGDGATNKSAAGVLNEAIDFDGTDDVVECGSPATLDDIGTFSLGAWVYPEGYGPSGWGMIASKGIGSPGVTEGWRLGFDGSGNRRIFFVVDYTTTDLTVRANPTIPLNEWVHVLITWDGSTTATNAKLYINGVEANYTTQTNASGTRVSDASRNFGIGTGPTADLEWNGSIDEVVLFKRVLSASEVTELYTRQKGQYGGGEPGVFTSRVMDSSNVATTWKEMLVLPKGPYQKERRTTQNETTYYANGASIAPIVNLHFNDLTINNGALLYDEGGLTATVSTNNGTSTKIASGKFGNAMNFDSSADRVTLTNSGALTTTGAQSKTWTFWMYRSGQTDQWGSLWVQYISNDNHIQVASMVNHGTCGSGMMLDYAGSAANKLVACSTAALSDNRWYHVAIVYDATLAQASRTSIYVDGVSQTMAVPTNTGTLAAGHSINTNAEIGEDTPWGDTFVGKLDEFMVFNSALTGTEVANLYQRGIMNLRFQIRSCDDNACSGETFVGPDGTAATYFSELLNFGFTTPNYSLPGTLIPNRYFQYRATLSSDDASYRPQLDKVRVRGN